MRPAWVLPTVKHTQVEREAADYFGITVLRTVPRQSGSIEV